MKIQWPSMAEVKKHRKMLALAVLVLVSLAAIDLIWLKPVINSNHLIEAKIRQHRELANKYQAKLKQSQSIKEKLAQQEQDLKQMQKRLFRGTDPYQLAASLGDLLKSSEGDGKNLDVKTYQVLASKEYGLYQEVHLRFNLMTNVEGLFYFLERIKHSDFAILVHEINIQKIQRNRGPDLVVNVILAALMEKGEKA
jgi:Tfp pilus assembly protein PilO